MVRKKTSPAPRPDGLPRSVREALGHTTDVHPTIEALYQQELRLRDHFQRDPLRSKVKRDPLAALGIGSGALAFLLWAIPGEDCFSDSPYTSCPSEWFSPERLPAVAAFLALSFILLLLRRR